MSLKFVHHPRHSFDFYFLNCKLLGKTWKTIVTIVDFFRFSDSTFQKKDPRKKIRWALNSRQLYGALQLRNLESPGLALELPAEWVEGALAAKVKMALITRVCRADWPQLDKIEPWGVAQMQWRTWFLDWFGWFQISIVQDVPSYTTDKNKGLSTWECHEIFPTCLPRTARYGGIPEYFVFSFAAELRMGTLFPTLWTVPFVVDWSWLWTNIVWKKLRNRDRLWQSVEMMFKK